MDMRIEHRAGVDCGTGCGRKRRESGEGRTLNLNEIGHHHKFIPTGATSQAS